MPRLAKSSLSAPRARLLVHMQRLNFGRIENLEIRDGDPVFDPAPQFVRDVKFNARNGPRPEAEWADFVLKAEVLDFFAQLDELGNGTIRALEVQHGLPFKMEVETPQA